MIHFNIILPITRRSSKCFLPFSLPPIRATYLVLVFIIIIYLVKGTNYLAVDCAANIVIIYVNVGHDHSFQLTDRRLSSDLLVHVPCSSLGPDTSYPYRSFVVFSTVSRHAGIDDSDL
jgi:hypothetical protein